MIRFFTISFFLLLFNSVYAQYEIVLNNNFFLNGEEIYGAWFDSEENDQIIHIYLVSNKKQIGEKQLFRSKGDPTRFHLAVPDTITSGLYSLQFFREDEKRPILSKTIPIINSNELALDNFNLIEPRETLSAKVNTIKLSPDSIDFDLSQSDPLLFSVKDLSQDLNDSQLIGTCDLDIKPYQSSPTEKRMNIDGRVLANGNPLKYKKLLISIYENSIVRFLITNGLGEFSFQVSPFEGDHQLFVFPVDHYLDNFQVVRTQNIEFLETCPLKIAAKKTDLKKLIEQRLTARMVEKYYSDPPESTSKELSHKAYLIEADHTVDLSEYINFTSFKELIKESVPNVFFKKDKIWVFNEENSRTFPGPPLILINGIPIEDDSILYDLNLEKISHVQVIHTLRKRLPVGDAGKNGVVFIHTAEEASTLFASKVQEMKIIGLQPKKNHVTFHSKKSPYMPPSLEFRSNFKDKTLKLRKPDYPTKLLVKKIIKSDKRVKTESTIIDLKENDD